MLTDRSAAYAKKQYFRGKLGDIHAFARLQMFRMSAVLCYNEV